MHQCYFIIHRSIVTDFNYLYISVTGTLFFVVNCVWILEFLRKVRSDRSRSKLSLPEAFNHEVLTTRLPCVNFPRAEVSAASLRSRLRM